MFSVDFDKGILLYIGSFVVAENQVEPCVSQVFGGMYGSATSGDQARTPPS